MDEFARRTDLIERQFALLLATGPTSVAAAPVGAAAPAGPAVAAADEASASNHTELHKRDYRILHLVRACDIKDAQLKVLRTRASVCGRPGVMLRTAAAVTSLGLCVRA